MNVFSGKPEDTMFLEYRMLVAFFYSQDYICFACSRKTDLRIFPVEVFGSSLNTIFFGTLNPASLERQNFITSFSWTEIPDFSTTKAQGVSPHFSSGRATTAASRISGC